MTFESWFAERFPAIALPSAAAVLKLAAEEATIPFIARYRKEQTGGLDEVAIQNVIDSKTDWDHLIQRQQFIVAEIEKQGKLTPELKESLLGTFDAQRLEDLYLPYKQKKKSKAQLAREAGLEPLADWIWNIGHGTETPQPGQTLELWAFTFKNEEKGFADAQAAIEGAGNIIVERLSENSDLRHIVRTTLSEKGALRTGKAEKAKPNSKFEPYFNYHESLESLLKPENSHRYLAIRRGWIEEELTLALGGAPETQATEDASEKKPEAQPDLLVESLQKIFEAEAVTQLDSEVAPLLLKSARLAFKAHVFPAIENEFHKALKKAADEVAIDVFAENVRKLLLASPFGPKAVLGVDPGIRTGCKLAVVDDSGKYIASTVIHLQSEGERKKATELVTNVCQTGNIQSIAVGNGTGGRETETFLRKVVKDAGLTVPVVMVSESGASVYSASEVAREEFPDLDLTVRGAISIARRLQDPLAELIKIDPKSIGVGQYQHDVSQPALKHRLDLVVDMCVNSVGVNPNTASHHLLAHVSGIGEGLAKSMVEYRGVKGLFQSREDLLEVPRFSKRTFEQAAGFLRIPNSKNPLDNTGVHPERYSALENVAKRLGKDVPELLGEGVALLKKDKELKEELGEFTFKDVIGELEKPGRDPRDTFVPVQFRDDIHELKDVTAGMICPGVVTNVTNFGAFVDIGVHQDGLVHISQLSHNFVKDPQEVVSPGDRVTIKVLEINLEKKQLSLSIKAASEGPARTRAPRQLRDQQPQRAPKPKKELPPLQPHERLKVRLPSEIKADRTASGPRPGASRPNIKPPKEKVAFNNAFAGLAALKDSLKK